MLHSTEVRLERYETSQKYTKQFIASANVQSKYWAMNILTRNVELLRRILSELFHRFAARKLFRILFPNLLNRLLRCGDMQDGRNRESLSDTQRNVFVAPCYRTCVTLVPRITFHFRRRPAQMSQFHS